MPQPFDEVFAVSAVCTVKDVTASKFISTFAKHMKRQGRDFIDTRHDGRFWH